VSVQALLQLARVYMALTDPNGARAVLTQVHDILQQRPDLGVLSTEAAQLRANVDTMREMTVGASSLTTAELRLLPLLATHLSFRQIGQRLYLSQHTVKSQALSVYRTFGVSSRNEAIERAYGLGVLETTSPVVGSRTRTQGPPKN
jgi:LuxR family maltose regulon positive regulatory protein